MADPNTSSNTTTAAQSATAATKSAMLVQLTTDGVPKLHCPVCDKALVSLSGYVKHVKKHEPPGGFLCRYCVARFCSEDELKKHRDKVHTTIMCRLCTGVTFTNETDYREHIRIVHNGIDRQMLKCDKCGAEYKTIYPFKRHMETECGTIKPYKCDHCSMSFVTKYNLKQHKELHTGERKFCCSYCGKNFLQKGRLVEHERSHTGEKPHKCDVCGKCFAHRESIVTHSSIHTGVRLVECKCCLTRFSCHSNLIKHRRTRPDTCGLPQFDPPKQRVRTHRLRIPPTLNPTSEIKVSNSNRIIKPDHKEQVRKTQIKQRSVAEATKLTARKSTSGRRGRKPGVSASKRKQNVSTTDTEEDDDENDKDMWHTEFDALRRGKAKTKLTIEPSETARILRNGIKGVTKFKEESDKYLTDSDDDYADFDPAENDSEDDLKLDVKFSVAKMAGIKAENSAHHENELDNQSYDDDELEFIDSREFVDAEVGVKSEDGNIFNDKDKLLDCWLNDDGNKMSTRGDVKAEQAGGLHETELILVKNENSVNYVEEEDILDVDHRTIAAIGSCKILLQDVCERYPSLKDESSIRVTRSAVSFPRSRVAKKSPPHQGADESLNNADTRECLMEPQDCSIELQKLHKRIRKVEPDEEVNKLEDSVGDLEVKEVKKSKKAITTPTTKLKRGRKPRKFIESTNISNSANENGENLCTADDGEQNTQAADKSNYNNKPKKAAHRPSRMAKLSQKELKARLKLLKRAEKPWQCPYCIKVYHIRKPFEKHLRDDHQRPQEEIKETFKAEEGVIGNEEVFKCHICFKIYLMEKRLTDHIKLHGPDGSLTFKCPCYCSIYFATKEEATTHARKEHRDLIFCNICEKYMTGHDSLKNHMKKHEQEKDSKLAAKRNFVCDKCGKKFSGRTSLTDHVRSDCGRQPLYQCSVCGKHLTTAGILKTHLLLHKDDTPYQCDKCGKTFKVKAQYKTHIKTRHTDYKPFQCHLCTRAYPYRESLLTHMTVHTGIKRFLCNGCGKRFTCVSNLQAHRKVHSETCGQLPLNAKATQYMGVQKGNLLLGAKPEAGVDYKETNTLIAKEVIDRDRPMAQEINYPSEPSAPLATVPLNYTQTSTPRLLLPQADTQFVDGAHVVGSVGTAYT